MAPNWALPIGRRGVHRIMNLVLRSELKKPILSSLFYPTPPRILMGHSFLILIIIPSYPSFLPPQQLHTSPRAQSTVLIDVCSSYPKSARFPVCQIEVANTQKEQPGWDCGQNSSFRLCHTTGAGRRLTTTVVTVQRIPRTRSSQ